MTIPRVRGFPFHYNQRPTISGGNLFRNWQPANKAINKAPAIVVLEVPDEEEQRPDNDRGNQSVVGYSRNRRIEARNTTTRLAARPPLKLNPVTSRARTYEPGTTIKAMRTDASRIIKKTSTKANRPARIENTGATRTSYRGGWCPSF